jgi:hypothetical protein
VNATNALLGVEPTAVCTQCHESGEEGKGFMFAKGIRLVVDSLDSAYETSVMLVAEANQKGMEVGDAEFRLREARQSRLEARTVIHSFDEEKTLAVLQKGLATTGAVTTGAREAIEEYYFRRAGLGVATLIITVLALSLYAYVRRLEKSQAQTEPQKRSTSS